jgi:integrase
LSDNNNRGDAHGKKVLAVEVEGAKEKGGLNAGATEQTTQQADVKGKILEYLWHLKKQGYSAVTIKGYGDKLKYVAKHANLLDPEAVKEWLAKTSMSETSKNNYTFCLRSFYNYLGVSWNPPTYKKVSSIPFIPTEQELDLLIANSSKTLAALLQLLKETGMRVGEALKLKWTDIDFERKTLRVTPEKGSLPRILPISDKAIGMLKRLQIKNEKIFPSRNGAQTVFFRRRKQLAMKLQNPRLLKIGFHSFRHWKGTMEYHKTKDILHVERLLGHKNIQNTLIYVNIEQALFQNTNEEFHVATAKTVEEACRLIEVGFEYVNTIDGVHIYRKRK